MIIDTLSRHEILEAIIVLAARDFPADMNGDIAASFNEAGEIDIHYYPMEQQRIRGNTELVTIFDDAWN